MTERKKRQTVLGTVLLLQVLLAGCATFGPPAASNAAVQEKIQALEARLALMESRQSQRVSAWRRHGRPWRLSGVPTRT